MEQIPPMVHESWHSHLQPLFDNPKMRMLKYDILPNSRFYPEARHIFRVFSMPLDKIRVVILGQDPYSNPGEAIGFSFAVNVGVKIPASLEIIKNEIINSGVERDSSVHIDYGTWRTLEHWHRQGVFLLNTALTVEFKNPGSHLGYWQWFTREVIEIISKQNNCVWLLWGAPAKACKEYIANKVVYPSALPKDVDHTLVNYNVVFQCDHPAAEVYNGGVSKTKFTGSGIFKSCNKALKLMGKTIINF